MNYHDQLSAAGKEADGKINAVTGGTIHDHEIEGSAVGAKWDTDVTSAKPPVNKTIFGSSHGSMTMAAMRVALNPRVVRAFNPSDAVAAHGLSIVYSNDGNHNRGYDLIGVTSISAPAAQSWLKELQGAFYDKTKPHFVIWGHEEDIHNNDPAKLEAVYKGGKVVLDNMRANGWNVKSVVTTTGMVYESNAYQKWNLPSAEIIGVDNYQRRHWDVMN